MLLCCIYYEAIPDLKGAFQASVGKSVNELSYNGFPWAAC